MRKFYKFTKATVEDRRQELLEFVTKYNKKYNSYNSVTNWIKGMDSFYIKNSDGFEFADKETSVDPCMWGHGGLVDYSKTHHILVNDNINLGSL